MAQKISDNEIDNRLFAALEALGDAEGKTIRGTTTLNAARQALSLLKFGLIYAAAKNSDTNEAITAPPDPLPRQSRPE